MAPEVHKPRQRKTVIRKRKSVVLQPPDVRDRCMHLGRVFAGLEAQRDANGGKLPYGGRPAAIAELHSYGVNLTINQFEELWERQYLPYRNAFPDSPPEEAFSPHPVGRAKGRSLPPEVISLIQQLYAEPSFQSLNYDGTLNAASRPASMKAILHGVHAVFPQYQSIVKLHHVYSVVKDMSYNDRAKAILARGRRKVIDENMMTRNTDIRGVLEQVQLDIRPLPTYVQNGSILCTCKAIILSDRHTHFILAACLIPSKSDHHDEALSGEFTAQAVREVIAEGLLTFGRRMRMLYADNGSQFRANTLQPYMHYLSLPGELPTELIHREPDAPRGGGHIERVLGGIDVYLQKFAGTYRDQKSSDEESYRDVLKRITTERRVLPTFDHVANDFQHYIQELNTLPEHGRNGYSRYELCQQGPDFSLELPPTINLVVFARSVVRRFVKVQRDGIRYQNITWEPYHDTPDVRAAWLKATVSREKRELLVMAVRSQSLLFVDLEGTGATWHQVVKKGMPRNTIREDKQRNRAARRLLGTEHSEGRKNLEEMLHELIGGPLVLNASATKLVRQPRGVLPAEDAASAERRRVAHHADVQPTPAKEGDYRPAQEIELKRDNTGAQDISQLPDTRKKTTRALARNRGSRSTASEEPKRLPAKEDETLWGDF